MSGPIPKKLPHKRRQVGNNGSAAGRRHMGNVKKVGCVITGCGRYAEAHHPITMREGSRASDFNTIALCFYHHKHESPLAVGDALHKGSDSFFEKHGSEAELLERTRRRLRMAGLPDGTEH